MNEIEISNLCKIYKNGVKALDNFNLKVKSGEIFTLLGENGAGKSTLIKILTTYLDYDSGEVKIFNENLKSNYKKIRKDISCVSQNISIDSYLSLRENMKFQSEIYHLDKKVAKKRIDNLIEAFELSYYLNHPVASFSGGIKRRLDLALSMVSNPKILFLDEPTVGMDIKSRISMEKMIKNISKEFKTTVFLTTHYLEEADRLSDKICIMKNGKDIITNTPENLKNYLNSKTISINFKDKYQAKKNIEILNKEFKNLYINENQIIIDTTNSKDDFKKAIRILNNCEFYGIQINSPSLDDIFLKITDEKEDL